MSDLPVTDALDVERGAVCEDCERPFALGEPYSVIPDSFVGDAFVGVTVCVACGLRRTGPLRADML